MRRFLAIGLCLPAIPVWAQDIAPSALNSFTTPPAKIASATVYRQDGSVLGNIQGFERSPGAIASVSIGVAGGRVISLRAFDASYDAVSNVVVTDMVATMAALEQKASP